MGDQEKFPTANVSDQAAEEDSLGFAPYVTAIATFLTDPATKPPLTLSIEGEWGSGKSSFMKQLQNKIEEIEKIKKAEATEKTEAKWKEIIELESKKPEKLEEIKKLDEEIAQIRPEKNKPAPKFIWFNAWRHDKSEALWAAFALEFLRQISTPRSEDEWVPIGLGHLKLLLWRLNWKENWLELGRIFFLTLFFACFAVALPILFFKVGPQGINTLSDQVVCRLSPKDKPGSEKASDSTASPNAVSPSPSPTTSPSPSSSPSPSPAETSEAANQSKECASDLSSDNRLGAVLNWLLIFGGFGGSVTGALALLLKLGEIIGDPKNDLKKYLEHPNYESQVAFIEKFHEDFEKIVTAYAGKGNKVYVFIDDLDRCEAPKSGELMQAINLMIANDPHLIFILGMDREKVAASIALKQKDILPYLQSSGVTSSREKPEEQSLLQAGEYGYKFIEKFIQLPFQVPQPRRKEDGLDLFLNKIFETEPPAQFRWKPFFQELLEAIFDDASTSLSSGGTETSTSGEDTIAEEQNRNEQGNEPDQAQEFAALRSIIDEDLTSEKLKYVVRMVAPALDYNPRRLKLFINLVRLKAHIAWNTKLEGNGDRLTPEQLGKFTAISLQWPLFILDLQNNKQLLAKLQEYVLEHPDSSESSASTDKSLPESHPPDSTESPASTDKSSPELVSPSLKYLVSKWHQDQKLVNLLKEGCFDAEGKLKTDDRHRLDNIDISKLLEVSPPIIKVGGIYTELELLLQRGEWRAADKETLRVMLIVAKQKVAMQEAQRYLTSEDIMTFPCEDLRILDQLWVDYSGGKFGFSVQKQIYVECGAKLDGKFPGREIWLKFCDRVGWMIDGEYINHMSQLKADLLNSPYGELPYWCFRVGFHGFHSDYSLFSRAATCRL